MHFRTRRQFVRAALGTGATLWGAGPALVATRAFAQAGAERFLATELRGGVFQLIGVGGNITMFGNSSGVALVDSGSPGKEAQVLNFVAERFGGAPIEYLINTHWHLDHTGGNDDLGKDAQIIAHENTRLWMSTEFYVDWEGHTYQPRSAAARPTETYYSSDPQPIELSYAGKRIEYGLLREAHTDGDTYAHFPDQNVIVAGGAVTAGQYPVLDYATGGSIGGLIDAIQMLIDISDAQTLIVPAVGPAQKRTDLEAQLDMLSTVRQRMQTMARQGKSVAEMLAAGITMEFDPRFGNNAERFVSNLYNSLWGISR